MKLHYAFIVLSFLFLAGCHRSAQEPNPSPSSVATSFLSGAISSAYATPYQLWFSEIASEYDIYSDLEVTSSGSSVDRLLAKSVDFASTDTPPSPFQMSQGLLAFPVTANNISIAYHHPSCQLTLSLLQVAAVLSGQISDYRQFGCASLPITVYYRSGLSGTNANLNSALSSESPVWRSQHASSLKLTLSHGIPVTSSGSMRESLMSQPGAFGYLDAAFVEPPLQSVSIHSSQVYRPDPKSGELALTYLKLDSSMLGSLVAPTKGYPIVSINWLLLRRDLDQSKANSLRHSLNYIYSKRGQEAAELLGYLRLPPSILKAARDQVGRLP